MANYPAEKIYEVWWKGPYSLEEIQGLEAAYKKTISLYAIYDDHPLYGRQVLTYIGMTRRDISKRLFEHDLEQEVIYVANISLFKDWKHSDDLIDYKTHRTSFLKEGKQDEKVIADIEALLIHALRPADNSKNKNTARHSWSYRLFNTGQLGSIPREISGHYTLHNLPEFVDGSFPEQ